MADLTHWERIRATIDGQATDRIAVNMWRHFYDRESDAVSLAEAMLAFQSKFDWDFMKINPRASYHMEVWGLKTLYENGQPPEVVDRPIINPDDWLKLEPQKPNKGVLQEQLEALELISNGLKGEVPFIMAVFTPASIASRLVSSPEVFIQHLHEHFDKVNYALDVITDTFVDFCEKCLERHVSGFFIPITAWPNNRLTEVEYNKFAKPYDLKLLNSILKADFNLLHVCGNHNLLNTVKDYPVHAFNWDSLGDGNPSLVEGKALVGDKVVMGGLACIMQRRHLIDADPEQLAEEVRVIRDTMGNTGWILSPGCVYPGIAPEENVRAIRQAVDS